MVVIHVSTPDLYELYVSHNFLRSAPSFRLFLLSNNSSILSIQSCDRLHNLPLICHFEHKSIYGLLLLAIHGIEFALYSSIFIGLLKLLKHDSFRGASPISKFKDLDIVYVPELVIFQYVALLIQLPQQKK